MTLSFEHFEWLEHGAQCVHEVHELHLSGNCAFSAKKRIGHFEKQSQIQALADIAVPELLLQLLV